MGITLTDAFRSEVLLTANIDHDSDTVSVIQGEIAGSFYGHDDVPEVWFS